MVAECSYKRIAAAAVCRLHRSIHREIDRIRRPGDEDVAGAVQGDPITDIRPGAAQVGCVQDATPIGVERGYESIVGAIVDTLICIGGNREIRCISKARDVGVPGGIRRDGGPVGQSRAAQISGVLSLAGSAYFHHKSVAFATARLQRVQRRKIRRLRLAGHVNVPGRVQRDPGGGIVRNASKIGCIDQSGACGVQLGHEAVIRTAAIILLERARRGGEVDGSRISGNMRFAGRIHGDSGAVVVAASSQKSRVNQPVAARVQFKNEGFALTHETGSQRATGDRKISRICEAGNVGVACRIHRHAKPHIPVTAPNVGGVHQTCSCRVPFGDKYVRVPGQ